MEDLGTVPGRGKDFLISETLIAALGGPSQGKMKGGVKLSNHPHHKNGCLFTPILPYTFMVRYLAEM